MEATTDVSAWATVSLGFQSVLGRSSRCEGGSPRSALFPSHQHRHQNRHPPRGTKRAERSLRKYFKNQRAAEFPTDIRQHGIVGLYSTACCFAYATTTLRDTTAMHYGVNYQSTNQYATSRVLSFGFPLPLLGHRVMTDWGLATITTR